MLCVYIATEKLTEIATSSACAPLNERTFGGKGMKSWKGSTVVVVRRERGIRRRQVAWRTTGKRRGENVRETKMEIRRASESDEEGLMLYKTVSKENEEQGQTEREASMKDEDKVYGTKTRRRHWKDTNEVIKDKFNGSEEATRKKSSAEDKDELIREDTRWLESSSEGTKDGGGRNAHAVHRESTEGRDRDGRAFNEDEDILESKW